MARRTAPVAPEAVSMSATRGYQQEMLEESMRSNIIIALDTGSGKTHIAVLRMKNEVERQPTKVSWFVAPTVALCQQQRNTIQTSIPVSVGIISGSLAPEQWKNADLWKEVLRRHRIMVTTPQVLLDAMRHGYVHLGRDISLLVFDEAHHAVDKHPYNVIMEEFYFCLPPQTPTLSLDIARPTILGLTASPIYGGNVVKAFQTIENNLDSVIRAPQRYRMELAKFVHRPVFRHILYAPVDEMDPPFSTNLASLLSVVKTLNIEDDPYVCTLRQQLAKAIHGTSEYSRLDQRLSGVIFKENTFTHRGLRDFARTAEVILSDLGAWAADWYVWQVLEKAKHAANPYNNVISSWKNSEKTYLLGILNKIVVSPVSFYPDDIADDSSDKVRALIDCLISEKRDTEAENESYSGLVFVERRDAVLALAEVLRHHPRTKGLFQLGCLLGTSDNSRRHSFLDITRTLLKEPQEEILSDFKIGERNVIISTAVAEEGIDIQACGSVIRWDPPTNMASWAQSRGRARRQRSTFTLMFEIGGNHQKDIVKWIELEQQMVALYNDPSRELETIDDNTMDDEEDDLEFRVTSTGALLTLHSAVSHLAHFCAVIPTTSHVDNRPLYDTDPPELPEGWHSSQPRSKNVVLYPGPFGSKVTLPRCLHLPSREFSVGLEYKTRISAHRHAAFKAYLALYHAELLNDHLLPITSVVEPHLEDEVKAMLQDVEKRAGFANVSIQMDPWAPEEDEDCWRVYVLIIDTLPPLRLLTRSGHISFPEDKGPLLYRSGHEPMQCYIKPAGVLSLTDTMVVQAQEYTRRLFWSLNGSRMKWDNLNFSYLFLPINQEADTQWESRRTWLTEINQSLNLSQADEFFANAEKFGAKYLYPDDIAIVRNGFQFAKGYRFVRWRFEVLSPEEEVDFREEHSRLSDLEITYPLLVVEPLPPRTNFLIPTPPPTGPPPERKTKLLLPRLSSVVLLSKADTEYAFLLPSVLRSVSMALTAESLRRTLFTGTPLFDIPLPLLITATTAPVSGEKHNYQRLETLGDTVLKFVVGIQLIAEYPLWHEGYLTKRKDHAVSNVRLAKEDIAKGVYRWIIRDRMLGKKWKPMYLTNQDTTDTSMETTTENNIEPPHNEPKKSKKKPKPRQELSTKVLADVIESLIGAAYIHGSFDLGYECAKFFDLGLKWAPLQTRIESLLLRIETHDNNLPGQLEMVERMLGYTFQRKHILIEALTHASYEQDSHTSSYERLEFLGDSVLDMVVTDFLYHAPGKNYSPGHMFLRKSAMVNAHILAYICLRTCIQIDAAMPGPSPNGRIAFQPDTHLVYLWQCLLHSSPRVLEDQANSHARFMKRHEAIEESLLNGDIFPWAELTRLQAPKFLSDIIESLLGAAFLDSGGNLDVAKGVMRHLGIMQIMEHIVQNDVDVLHPVSRLSLWAGKHNKELKYEYEKKEGNVSCIIVVDGKEEVRQTDIYRGLASQEQARFLAAEKAIKMFRLRDVNMNYTLMKRKTTPKKKKKPNKNAEKDSTESGGVKV